MVNFTYDFNTDSVSGAAIQTALDELNTGLSNITDANFKATAAIAQSRLGTITANINYEVPLLVPAQITGGWPAATNLMAFVPVEEGITVVGASWFCSDIGGGAGVGRLDWGYVDASANWNQVHSLATISFTDFGGASGTGQGDVTINETVLTAGGGVRGLGLVSTVTDATMLTGADKDFLVVSVRLKKSITI